LHSRLAARGLALAVRAFSRQGRLPHENTLRVFAYIRRYPWMAAGTLACAVLTTALLIVFPKVTKLVIDDVGAGDRAHLTHLSLIAFGAFFLRHLFNALRILLNNTFEQRVIFDLRAIFIRTSSNSR